MVYEKKEKKETKQQNIGSVVCLLDKVFIHLILHNF